MDPLKTHEVTVEAGFYLVDLEGAMHKVKYVRGDNVFNCYPARYNLQLQFYGLDPEELEEREDDKISDI